MSEPAGSETDIGADEPTKTVGVEGSARRLSRGASVGRLVILDILGGGATGTVYSAFDPVLDRQVALKILHPWIEEGTDAGPRRARVEREARAMARIKHPHVVTIYDVGVSRDGALFLAMEKIEGPTLGRWLQREKRGWRDVLRVFCGAGEGLAAAHAKGIVHRDFKLDNVLMDEEGNARVTDFGLARAPGDRRAGSGVVPVPGADRPSSASLSEPLTQSGALLGTPGYMPPEQYGFEPIDERADVFAFCAALYRGLYGERPFPGDTVEEIASSTITGKIRDAPRGTDVPAWLRRVVLRGLATDRAQRPASMAALLAMLRDDPARRWRRAIAAIGAVAALGAIAWGVHASGARRARECEAAGDRLGGIWDPARKERVAAAFRAIDRPWANEAWAQVERTIDDYARRWTSAREGACLATRVRGEQSQAMYELRSACLDDRLAELRALSDLLATADRKVIETSTKAARSLSALDACADVDRLSASTRMPDDPAARSEIRALLDDMAQAKELHESARKREAVALLESDRARVEAAAWGPLLVTWHVRYAVSERQADEKAALASYRSAIQLAERHRLDETKAAVEIGLGSFEGSWAGHPEVGHEWMRMADATIARLGGSPRLEVQRDEEEGWIYQYEHKLAQAAPLFERVIARAESAGLTDPDTPASAHSGLASALAADGRVDEALAHAELALKIMADGYSADHPLVSGFWNNLAVSQLDAGRVDDAIVTATRARDMLAEGVRRGDLDADAPDFGIAEHTLGEALHRAHRFDEAAVAIGKARDVYRAAHGDDNADVAYADNELAAALRRAGRAVEAERSIAEASAIEARIDDAPSAIVAGTLAMQSTMALDRRDAKAAVERAEKAMEAVRGGDASAREVAEIRLALAHALVAVGGDRDRARELAAQARETFARMHDAEARDEAAGLERTLVADVAEMK